MKNKNRIDKNYFYLCVFLIITISIPNMLVCMSTLGNGKDEIGTLASGAFFQAIIGMILWLIIKYNFMDLEILYY